MSAKPAARLSDPTSCPVPGHGTPAIQSGSPDVLINGLPAARLGDTAGCGQTISGAYSTTVFINGKNAVTLGSTLSHGGVIIGGSGDVLIGDTVVAAPFITPSLLATDKWISFQIPAASVTAAGGASRTSMMDRGSTASSTATTGWPSAIRRDRSAPASRFPFRMWASSAPLRTSCSPLSRGVVKDEQS